MAPLTTLRTHLRVPEPDDFRSAVHDTVVVAKIGRWLGIGITVCLVTGLLSHNAQSPSGVLLIPRPSWGYRVTQGVHVASGIACIPLLLAKIYAAYPRLFARPLLPKPDRAGLPHLLERASIGILVVAAFFEITTGLLNINQWYAFGFNFVPIHYALAWVMGGALLIHLAVKLPVIRGALASPRTNRRLPAESGANPLESADTGADPQQLPSASTDPRESDRRGFVLGALATAGGLTVLTVGESFTPLSRLAILAPRRPDEYNVQGVPINKTAAQAGIAAVVAAPTWADEWSLDLTGSDGARHPLHLTDLAQLDQVTVSLPIACVEGWSVQATWSGVRVRDLLELVGGREEDEIVVTSLEQGSPYSVMTLPPAFAHHRDTLLATRLNGQVLHVDHGYPARIIAPNRPGVLQTKWVMGMAVQPS